MLQSIFNKFIFFVFNTKLGQRFKLLSSFYQQPLDSSFTKKNISIKTFFKKSFYKTVAEYAHFSKQAVLLNVSKTETASASIRFKTSDITENVVDNISSFFKKNQLFYFLRKHKLFNKGRFSRNRQTYRTGAYWCLWVNILAVTGFYYWFYRFTMNFGYLWPFFSLFILSFIIPRALKYNYLYLPNLFSSIFKLFVWFYLIILNYFNFFYNFFFKLFDIFLLTKNQKNSVKNFNFFFIFDLYFSFFKILSAFFSFINLWLVDKQDLMIKQYSHWNYFLPLGWIHRNHRLFFYKRIYYIIFS